MITTIFTPKLPVKIIVILHIHFLVLHNTVASKELEINAALLMPSACLQGMKLPTSQSGPAGYGKRKEEVRERLIDLLKIQGNVGRDKKRAFCSVFLYALLD